MTETGPNTDGGLTTFVPRAPSLHPSRTEPEPPMSLHSHANHPSALAYVLKLHHDADPQHGLLRGRIEHIASGDHFEFGSRELLLSWLAAHAAGVNATTGGSADEDDPDGHVR